MAITMEGRKAYAAARWAALGDRLRTVTPETVARLLIGLSAIGVAVWLAATSWPALAPFVAGVVIAYAVLPIANRLDRFMPRVLAALIAELVAVGILVGVALLVVPPFLRSLVAVVGILPTADQVNQRLNDLQNSLGQLQEPIRGIVLAVTSQVVANLSGFLNGVVDGAATFVTAQILGFAGTLSFVLGLLVIPAWILTVVSDDQHFRRRALNLVTPGLRADVAALARIVDRAFGTFLRVQVMLAIGSGVFIWLGLQAASSLGIAEFRYAVSGAALLGILQLIPEVGFFLGLIPIALVLVVSGPVPALTVVAVYWAATKLAGMIVEPRVSRGVLDVHAALLIPGIVVLSQFGLAWTLVAAPLIAIGRDLVRYLAGRLADPPQPAGLLPGERRTRRVSAPASVPVPTAYRSVAGRSAPAASRAATVPAPTAASAGGASDLGLASAAIVASSSVQPVRVPRADTLPEPSFVPSSLAAGSLQPSAFERSLTP